MPADHLSKSRYLAALQCDRRLWLDVHDPDSATPLSEATLEAYIDSLESELAPLQRFILPGGTPAAAAFHLARTVCRRAERRTVTLHREEPLSAEVLGYLNRLSDLLFVIARVENARARLPDIEWVGRDR